jgi:hypothetical protein
VQFCIHTLAAPLGQALGLAFALLVVASLCSKLCATPQHQRAQFALRAALGNNSAPVLEVRALLTASVLTLGAYAAASAGADDLVDSAIFVVLALVFVTLAASLASLTLLLLYSISAASGGEVWRKAALADALNVLLCALRIALCWARYIFYDIQVEVVDLALHYTDEVLELNPATPAVLSPAHAALDIVVALLQTVLSLFKLAIASSLAWLTDCVGDLVEELALNPEFGELRLHVMGPYLAKVAL